MTKIHLIAIGGAVMHNLAIALKNKGFDITGSDDELFEPSLSRLKKHHIAPAEKGWFPEKIHADLDAVILGMHAGTDNPELKKAIELNLPVYSFPQYIFNQSENKIRVAICGSHGKTTITSMVMHVLKNCGKKFDYLVGAQLEGFETMVQLSDAPVIIIEGDEYFASPLDRKPKFLHYHAQINLITGIAWDHFNVFPTFEDYVSQFRLLLQSLKSTDLLIVNAEDAIIQELIKEGQNASLINYYTPSYELANNKLKLTFDNHDYAFEIFGRHNMQNMEGAKTICGHLGISTKDFYAAMQTFKGASKRLEIFKKNADHFIFRDFAHAPSKVKATVDAVKEQYPDKKLIACLELHTFSSLNKSFLPQYADTMQKADIKIIYINPHALELKKLPPLPVHELKNYFNDPDLIVINVSETLLQTIQNLNLVNSNILLMSSGNFDNLDFTILT